MTTPDAYAPSADHADGTATVDQLAEAVRGPLSCDPVRENTRAVVLRDTADHRLRRAGQWLGCEMLEDRAEDWQLTTLAGELLARAPVPAPVPEFADELPEGDLRTFVDGRATGRALHTIGEIRIAESVCALRDGEGKIRCRLALTTVTGPKGTARQEITVRALKGYEADARRLRTRIVDTLGWSPQDVPAVAQIITTLDSGPLRPVLTLAADDPAGPAMRDILTAQLDVMEDRLDGVIADRDPVYLHQFRVAIRRTRSALSQLRDAIALEGRAEAEDGFRWLGQTTSPLRDLDVQLIDLGERQRALGPEVAPLDLLARHLETLKTAAHRDLVLSLSGARYRTLVNHWRASLNPSNANWTATESLRAPFADIVSARGARVLKRVLREGRRIGPDSDAVHLHDLRKRMKKLRYVTEFLAEVLPRERMRPAIKALKGLQAVLGRVQDREVQVEALKTYGHALSGRGSETTEVLMAIGAWSGELDLDRRAARAAFADAFAQFAAEETQAIFRDIFSSGGGEAR